MAPERAGGPIQGEAARSGIGRVDILRSRRRDTPAEDGVARPVDRQRWISGQAIELKITAKSQGLAGCDVVGNGLVGGGIAVGIGAGEGQAILSDEGGGGGGGS
ncbi:MAG: hypothetical protein ACK56I_23355, partial [bacterium]